MNSDLPTFETLYLEQLFRLLPDAGVNFIVAGSVAGVLHGIERVPLDLDIALDVSPDNIQRFAKVMKIAGLQPRSRPYHRIIFSRNDSDDDRGKGSYRLYVNRSPDTAEKNRCVSHQRDELGTIASCHGDRSSW